MVLAGLELWFSLKRLLSRPTSSSTKWGNRSRKPGVLWEGRWSPWWEQLFFGEASLLMHQSTSHSADGDYGALEERKQISPRSSLWRQLLSVHPQVLPDQVMWAWPESELSLSHFHTIFALCSSTFKHSISWAPCSTILGFVLHWLGYCGAAVST